MSEQSHSKRVSFRMMPAGFDKLVVLAKYHGWFNSRGFPNLSKAVNYVLDTLDVTREKRAVARRERDARRKKK